MGKVIPFPSQLKSSQEDQGQRSSPNNNSHSLERNSFKTFVSQVEEGIYGEAAQTLTNLLGVCPQKAEKCVCYFAESAKKDSELIDKALELNNFVKKRSANESLMLLFACFGLQLIEGINALHHLRSLANKDQEP